ncbi:MAG: glycosyltransferase family 2 protein [Lachnospiraceae bacterium]|jgi:dolichol-phosphate mannosyltransferase|nr:glycosyltransferase family 2 protein [Lachnospiraceae bacterium]
MPLLSIVIPAYNEEDALEQVVPALREALKPREIEFEVIFIDDGSKDTTFEKIAEIAATDKRVRGYRFSRNFGKEAAIWAGLENASGDAVVVMDADLQHPPETLPLMWDLWQEGYEVVEGVKVKRAKEFFLRRFFAWMFYGIISSLSGFNMRTASDFKLLDRRVVDELLQFKERNAFFRGLSFWVGFRATRVEYITAPRKQGKTKWSFGQLTKYAFNNILGFSTAPMQLVSLIGALLLVSSLALGIQTLVRFFQGNAVEGFTTVILLLLLIGGALMVSLGVIGLYIAKIYEEVKGRPRYIISEATERGEAMGTRL